MSSGSSARYGQSARQSRNRNNSTPAVQQPQPLIPSSLSQTSSAEGSVSRSVGPGTTPAPSVASRSVSMPPMAATAAAAAVVATGEGSARSSTRSSTRSSVSSVSSSLRASIASAPSVPQEGLREIVKSHLCEDVFSSCMTKWKGWTVAVVDEPAMRMMSSVMGMYDLMEQRVTLVESITKKRAPFHEMAVLYVVAPTEENINQIIDDFMPTQGKKQPLYGPAVFIYFLSQLPDALFAKLKTCQPLIKRMKALGEINADFIAKENRAFSFDMKTSLPDLFQRQGVFTLTHFNIVQKLVTVCATLNEYPHIRYPANSELCRSLAEAFHNKMNEYVAAVPTWWYYGMHGHMERDRSTLLLLDRSLDPLSPLMHEFTYQAMVNDLLPIEDDKISYKSETVVSKEGESQMEAVQKDVLLNDNDELWVELRIRHIADVIQTLSSRIREVVDSDTGAKLAKDSGRSMTLSQMASALKQLPEYQEVMSKLSQHMYISHQCMAAFNKQGLLELAELEQTLATGQTEEGRTPKTSELVEQVENRLRSLSREQALRLLSTFIVSQNGTSAAVRNRLFAAAKVTPEEERTLRNFAMLGVSLNEPVVTSGAERMKSLLGGNKKAKGIVQQNDSEYSSSRYVCKLKGILEAMAENTLSIDDYPSVLPMPFGTTGSAASVRTKAIRRTSRWGADKKKAGFSGPRQIVFIAGGMCYSELRSAEEVMNNGEREFILGSTYFLKPAEYLKDISSL